MNKKIVVAGAGHGGLVAAALLKQNGFEVSVYEAGSRASLGHDWEDRFTFKILEDITGTRVSPDCWRFRGDCAFVSPSHRTNVIINYNESNRQRVMWRKKVIDILLDFAEKSGVNIHFDSPVTAPICRNNRVVGIRTEHGDVEGDLVIDAAGAFSPLRTRLEDSFGIDRLPVRGDIFYAYRAYFNKSSEVSPDVPFEVYLYHECEQGLSWFCTNDDNVDVLIGRIDPLNDKKVGEQLEIFRRNHPWLGSTVLHGGAYAVIPVRRPLDVMVADGYAAVGDSAFMTTPMNGMGIDLSLLAGKLLAETVIKIKDGSFTRQELWAYNRDFHRLYGADTAKNEGLKNSLLGMPAEGVDFLFDNAVIQSSDLAGAGRNTNIGSLLGKLFRGMKNPPYFFAIIKGLMNGAKASGELKKAPEEYTERAISEWRARVGAHTVGI